MRNVITGLLILVFVAGCATQRYGRQTPLSSQETSLMNCQQIDLEIAQSDAFLEDIRRQRSQTSGAHVLGALGDFGIGNSLEGDAAEKSGFQRRDQLRSLRQQKGCI